MRTTTKTNVLLWTIQALLAMLFLFAGVMKLITPIEAQVAQSGLPGAFLRFIGVAEVLGALGLILPGLMRVSKYLTSLAATGLVIIMVGAVGLIIADGGGATATIPLAVGLLLGYVAWTRKEAQFQF